MPDCVIFYTSYFKYWSITSIGIIPRTGLILSHINITIVYEHKEVFIFKLAFTTVHSARQAGKM